MLIENYNENITKELSSSNILEETDMLLLEKNMGSIKHALKHSQIFRTDVEARVSVLNDIKHPDADSKYWQSMRELKVQSDQMFYLNFDYKEKIIDQEELEHFLLTKDYENNFDKKRDKIKLEKVKYELLQMELTAKDRIREIDMWSKIQKELEPVMKYSKDDVNEHQLLSYGSRFINEYITSINMKSKPSPSEARNAQGLLLTTLSKIEKDGKMDLLWDKSSIEVRDFLIKNNLVKNKTIS